MSKSILPALIAWNISTRPLWLVRCGSSPLTMRMLYSHWATGTPVGAVGGSATLPYAADRDAPLNNEGVEFAKVLGMFVRSRYRVWEDSVRAVEGDDAIRTRGFRLSDGAIAPPGLCKVVDHS